MSALSSFVRILSAAAMLCGSLAVTATPAAAAAAPHRCFVHQLRGRIGRADHAAGTTYYLLRLTNTGWRTCTLDGWAGVSLLNARKRMIGHPAVWYRYAGFPQRLITLPPGRTAVALIQTGNFPNVSGDCTRTSTYVRVYAPNDYRPLLIPRQLSYCGDIFGTSAVR